jgi:hypothetical protein
MQSGIAQRLLAFVRKAGFRLFDGPGWAAHVSP